MDPPRSGGLAQGMPETPSRARGTNLPWLKGNDVNDALDTLGRKADIKFPHRSEKESPSKRRKSPLHEIKAAFSKLYFLDRDTLDHEIQEFLEWSPALKDDEEKVDYLHNHLNSAMQATVERTKSRSRNRPAFVSSSMSNNMQQNIQPPPSPTMGIKHAPKGTESDPIEIDAEQEGGPSGVTSMQTSFWSEIPNGPQDRGSPATSVDDSFETARDPPGEYREPYPTLGAGTTEDWIAKADRAEKTSLYAKLAQAKAESERAQQKGASGLTVEAHKPRPEEKIDNIVLHGLTALELPDSFESLSFELKWEVFRILQTKKISGQELDAIWQGPRTLKTLHDLVDHLKLPLEKTAHFKEFKNVTLHARLRWEPKDANRVFYLDLLPLRKEKSNSFQRRFGFDRFLYIEVPSLVGPPRSSGLDGNGIKIRQEFQSLVAREVSLLGRNWRQFHLKAIDANSKDPDFARAGGHQFVFFAVSGRGLDSIKIDKVVDFAVPLDMNALQPSCKAYARLDLMASQTTPTFTLKRSQIRFVPDVYPDDTPDDTSYNDPKLVFDTEKSKDPINDGCGRISHWLMVQIKRQLGLAEVPSVIQARVFGAKGMWVNDGADVDPDCEPPKVLLEISESQRKVIQRDDEDELNDLEKLTLALNDFSRPAHPSTLYQDFLPILIDRGVPKVNISQIYHTAADIGNKDLLSSVQEPDLCHHWLHRRRTSPTERRGVPAVEDFDDDMPHGSRERLLESIEAGFDPLSCRFIANETLSAARETLGITQMKPRYILPRSTMVYGVADPKDCLKPGEIYLSLSDSFFDELIHKPEDPWGVLHNMDALVARQPALGSSDMQRVRLVLKLELAHLKNVVVFPRKGPCSLASKLQGGDYDGDKFWICWEKLLVLPFKNAPVPSFNYTMADLRINVNKDTLSKTLRMNAPAKIAENQVVQWIGQNTRSRMKFNLLGSITIAYTSLIHQENGLGSERAQLLLCLHDNIIDADKRGLSLTSNDLLELKKRHNIPEKMKLPAYRKFLDSTVNRADLAPKNIENIKDYVFFEIVEKKMHATLIECERTFQNATSHDSDLIRFYDDAITEHLLGDHRLAREAESLDGKFAVMRDLWCSMTSQYGKEECSWTDVWRTCRAEYVAILPEDTDYFTSIGWLTAIGEEPSMWDKFKASALARHQSESNGKMMFHVALRELCWLKAAHGRPRILSSRAHANMTVKRPKRKAKDAELNDDDDEEDDEYGNEEGFSQVMDEV